MNISEYVDKAVEVAVTGLLLGRLGKSDVEFPGQGWPQFSRIKTDAFDPETAAQLVEDGDPVDVAEDTGSERRKPGAQPGRRRV
jgi:hypothetical protein